MSNILTFVGSIRSFFLIDTLPFFYFLTEEMFTIKFLASSTRGFVDGSPVDSVKNDI